jgi:hypothetical protein
MSVSSRRELLAVTAKRYSSSLAAERKTILDEFVSSTGYERNYAISLLCHPPIVRRGKKVPRSRAKTYGPKTRASLEEIWLVAGKICGKRLVPMLASYIDVLERFNEIDLSSDVRKRLLAISPATCDRLLAQARQKHPHGFCTTKPTPHMLLRSQVSIRTFADWDEAAPGFLEVDLVAHCGDSARGTFLFTLTGVDVKTGWTRCLPLPNKGMIGITKAMELLGQLLPFPLLGIDTDNGGEFINHNLVRYCADKKITMTRCRPYKKNDQCHVEQKNGNVVRAMAGYGRYEGQETLLLLGRLYSLLADFQNYYQPSMKLISKSRDGAKVTKTYDEAKTPYQRVLDEPSIAEDVKQRLTERYQKVNPAALQRSITLIQLKLRSLATDYNPAIDGADPVPQLLTTEAETMIQAQEWPVAALPTDSALP